MSDTVLTICVISHKQTALVTRLLESLGKFRPEFPFRVVVLENVQGFAPLPVEQFDFEIDYYQNETTQGLSANINQVFDYSRGRSEYFCVLNPDVVFAEKVFDRLVATMQEHQVDIIAPLMLDSVGEIQDSFRKVPNPINIVLRYLGLSKTKYRREALPQVSYPDWIAAMFMLMPSAVFDAVGGFNPLYELYFEDVDFCVRAKLQGFNVGVFRDVHAIHDAQRTSHRKVTYLLRHLNSAMRFFVSGVYRKFRRKRAGDLV